MTSCVSDNNLTYCGNMCKSLNLSRLSCLASCFFFLHGLFPIKCFNRGPGKIRSAHKKLPKLTPIPAIDTDIFIMNV